MNDNKNPPPIVWLDDRVARNLPQDKDAELAERGGSQTRYISQERVNALVDAARGPGEMIVQIQTVGEMLYGLSNSGRLFAFGQLAYPEGVDQATGELRAGWLEVAGSELAP